MNEEYYEDWKEDHMSGLEAGFIDKVTPPVLDDDITDYIEENWDEFEEYCRERFNIEDERGL